MVNTRATTQTNALRCGFGALYALLAMLSLLNVFFTLTPVDKSNTAIDDRLERIGFVPAAARPSLFIALIPEQIKNLEHKPSEPYGWSRLAWMYYMLGNMKSALPALQMSDLVSPYEAQQLPERAFMWHRLRSVENADQLTYQPALWLKAYSMGRNATWKLAMQNGLEKEIGASLKITAPPLYEEWKALQAAKR